MSKLKRFPKVDELFQDGDLVLDEVNLQHLENLVTVVVNKHFKNYHENEELCALGMATVVEVLKLGEFDPEKGSLKNFLYTSIRNACTNYLYHFKNSNKEIVSDEALPEGQFVCDVIPIVDEDIISRFLKKHTIVKLETIELIGCL